MKNKTNTEVSLEHIYIAFPKAVVIENLYIEDLQKDTLLDLRYMKVDLDMWGLFKRNIHLNYIQMEGLNSKIYTLTNHDYNFQFLVDAFSSGESTADTAKSSKPFDFDLDEVQLSQIDFEFDDDVNGMDVELVLGRLHAGFKSFSPLSNTYIAKDIRLEDTKLNFRQSKGLDQDEKMTTSEGDGFTFDIGADKLVLDNIEANYDSKLTATEFKAKLTTLEIEPKTIDLSNKLLAFDNIQLYNSEFLYVQNKLQKEEANEKQEKEHSSDDADSWTLSIVDLIGDQNSFQFHDYNIERQQRGIDPSHMEWISLAWNIQNVEFAYPSISAKINQFQGSEQSGFQVDNLTTNFGLSDDKLELKGFLFASPHSNLRLNADLEHPLLSTFPSDISSMLIDLNIANSTLGVRDVLFIQPQLRDLPPFKGNKRSDFKISGTIQGAIQDMAIHELMMTFKKQTKVRLNGRIKGLPHIDTTYFDLKIPTLRSSRKELLSLLPDSTLPKTIELPEQFSASAEFKGRLDQFTSQVDIETSLGNASIAGSLATSRGVYNYEVEAKTHQFQLGSLLQDTTGLGQVTMNTRLEGTHFEWDSLNAKLQATIQDLDYNRYRYDSISLNAQIDRKQVSVQGNIMDSNIILSLRSEAGLAKTPYSFTGIMDLKGSDLNALNFTSEDIKVSGLIDFEVSGIDPDSIRGKITFTDGLLVKDQNNYTVDSMYLYANTMDSLSRIDIFSDFAEGYLEGNIEPTQFAKVFAEHLDYYLQKAPDTPGITGPAQQFEFNIDIKQSPILTEVLVPGVSDFNSASISGTYDSREHNMQVDGFLPRLVYNGITFDTFSISIDSELESMQFEAGLQRISGSNFEVSHPQLEGKVDKRELKIALNVSEDSSYQSLGITGKFYKPNDAYQFQLEEEGLVLANEVWSIPDDNYIQFTDGLIDAHNFKLQQGQKAVKLSQREDRALVIQLERFSIQDIARIFRKEQKLASGTVDGKIAFNPTQQTTTISADIDIADFQFMESQLGTLSLRMGQRDPSTYTINLGIQGNQNDISAKGVYAVEEEASKIDLDIDINSLSLNSIEAFTLGELEETEGYLQGEFSINGRVSDPAITGNLFFHDASFRVSRLNTYYGINGQKLVFQKRVLQFEDFNLLDSLGNNARFDGRITFKDFTNPDFQLQGQFNNFFLLNKKERPDASFYGDLIVDGNLDLKGDLNRPKISSSVKILNGSAFSFVMPSDDPRLETSGGIDEFIDTDEQRHFIMKTSPSEDTTTTDIKGMDLRATVRTERLAEMRIYVDEGKSNYLKVQGEADLIFGIDPSGQITLTGRYRIVDGTYQLLFRNVVKRSFQLQEGGSIVWTGDPLKAEADLKAIYTKEAEPLPLLQGQMADQDASALNKYRQSIPFRVELNMRDKIISPTLDFDLSIPNEYQNAYGGELRTKINQLNQNESSVNKQVFALLVLGRFIPDDPFNVSGGGSAEATARRSVSRILNAQLDKLSDKYIDAFELDLNLESYEDYSTGEAEGRTELNVGINKSFFDDRLTVSVGGNIDLEGQQRTQQQASDLIGDISVEYALDANGNWKLRAFRKNEYEGIIDGDIIKTGASVLFSKDYDTLSELFHKKNQ